jgi:hypothetical protein
MHCTHHEWNGHCFITFSCNLGNLGERLDNFMGGNPNPTFGQEYGGAPGVGGYGGGYGYSRW